MNKNNVDFDGDGETETSGERSQFDEQTGGEPLPKPETDTRSEDEEEAEYRDADFDNLPRRNFVTGIDADEAEFDRRKKPLPSGLKKTILVAVVLACVIAAVVVFFIWHGRPAPETTIKDNTAKLGINANLPDQPSFRDDYQTRYLNNANAAGGGNINSSFGTVGGSITAPPNVTNTGGIYQPPGAIPPPIPVGGNATNNGGSSGGSSNGNSAGASGGREVERKPVAATIVPDKNTQIVELPAAADRQNQRESNGPSDQISLYFYDRPAAGDDDGGRIQKIPVAVGANAAARPAFGTVLPVKALGRMHTLGTNALARFELTRPVEGAWGSLPKGTMFVGRVSGGEASRLFVSLLGYIDQSSMRLVTIGGDLQGRDGALGIEGDVKRVGSQWKKVFGELFTTAKEIGTAYLLGRSGGNGTVINTGQLAQLPNQLDSKETTKFVLVEAGAQGYVVINQLPPAIETDERLAAGRMRLSDDDILKMVQTQSAADVNRILPGLSPQAKQIARSVYGQ